MKPNDYNMRGFYNQLMKARPMLYAYQFVVEFVPGGIMNNAVTFDLFNSEKDSPDQNFSYYAQSARLPAFEISKATASYYGTEFRLPTVIKYQHDWDVTLLLEQDMIMYEKLRSWMKMISDLSMNGGGYKTIPNVDMRISLLNSDHTMFTTSYRMVGVWPTNIPEIKLEYKQDDTSPITLPAKFKYQYCYRDDNFDGSGDPLAAGNHRIQ